MKQSNEMKVLKKRIRDLEKRCDELRPTVDKYNRLNRRCLALHHKLIDLKYPPK